MGLPDVEEINTLAFFQHRHVTDRQRDRQTDRHVAITRHYYPCQHTVTRVKMSENRRPTAGEGGFF